MTLTVALRTALSSLQVNQTALQIAANNISNVNTPGYTRKTAALSPVLVDGNGAGVQIDQIRRAVDQFLLRQVHDQYSALGTSSVRQRYLSLIQDHFGLPSDNTSMAHGVGTLGDAFEALSAQPNAVARTSGAVAQGLALAAQLAQHSRDLQALRAEADLDIARVVTSINDKLAEIGSLNDKIMRAGHLGQPTADLEDQRDRLVQDLSQQMDIRTFTHAEGDVVVMTASGRRLVDGNMAEQLSHVPASGLGATASYLPRTLTGFYNTGGVAGIYLGTPPDLAAGSNDITGEITGGRIKALIEMRDQMLAGTQSSMDELTARLRDAVNAAHNNGAAFPPPITLSGTQSVVGADPFSGTGSFRIALVNRTTGAASNVADISLVGLTTVTAVMTAINTAPGLGGNVTASIVGGKLQLATSNGTGIVINENTSQVAVGAGARGLSHFFGLNDFFTGSSGYANYDTNIQIAPSAALNLAGPLTFRFGVSTVNIAVGAGDSLRDIAANINADATLTAAGIRASLVSDGTGFRLRVVDGGGDNFFLSSAGTAVSSLGFVAGRVGASATLGVRAGLVSDSTLLTRGDVSTTAVVGDIVIGSGDGAAAGRISDVFAATNAFPASGNNLPALNETLADFAREILGRNSAQAANAEDKLEFDQSLFDQLSARHQNIAGVNLDEELSNLVVLQNAYAASARVINVASQLMDELINMFG